MGGRGSRRAMNPRKNVAQQELRPPENSNYGLPQGRGVIPTKRLHAAETTAIMQVPPGGVAVALGAALLVSTAAALPFVKPRMPSPNEFWLCLHQLAEAYEAEGLTPDERAA